MNKRYELSGKIASGAGEAAYFTQLPWVQKQCAEKLHFTPFPGTLNVQVDEGSLYLLAELQKGEAIELLSPDPTFCNARSLKASLGNVAGAIIIPAEDVQIHGNNTLEMIAPVSIKESLSLQDGDRVTVVVELNTQHSTLFIEATSQSPGGPTTPPSDFHHSSRRPGWP